MIYGTPLAGVDLAATQFWKAEGGEEGTYFMNDGDVEIGMVDATEMHPEMYLTQMAGGRIVIDSLSAIVVRYGIDGALKFLRLARDEMKKRNANLMFVVYTGIHPPMEMTRIMRAADIVIEFKTEVPPGRDRANACGPQDQGLGSTPAAASVHHHRQGHRGIDNVESRVTVPSLFFGHGTKIPGESTPFLWRYPEIRACFQW